MGNWCERALCVQNTETGNFACPKGHCRGGMCCGEWGTVIRAYAFSAALLGILVLGEKAFQGEPTRSPGASDGRFWKEDELLPNYPLVSTASLLVYISLPIILVSFAVCAAQTKDIQLNQGNTSRSIPFRGWAIGLPNIMFCWVSIITYILKYYNHGLRPIGLTLCKKALVEHGGHFYNASHPYLASLDELKECVKLDPDLFRGLPSGHSSTSFCAFLGVGLMFCNVKWLFDGLVYGLCCCRDNNACKAHIKDRATLSIWRALILICSTSIAAVISCSRIVDGSHFPVQVTAGSMIGIFFAYALATSPLLLPHVPLGGDQKFKLEEGVNIEVPVASTEQP
eukprot:Stramenopile-MAST_4_protein_1105